MSNLKVQINLSPALREKASPVFVLQIDVRLDFKPMIFQDPPIERDDTWSRMLNLAPIASESARAVLVGNLIELKALEELVNQTNIERDHMWHLMATLASGSQSSCPCFWRCFFSLLVFETEKKIEEEVIIDQTHDDSPHDFDTNIVHEFMRDRIMH